MVFVHNARMVDREASTLVPPPPAEKPDLDAQHKQLVQMLADHPDPHMRILAHISSRQFEMSERISDLTKMVEEKMSGLSAQLQDVKDRVLALDEGFVDIEERTSDLEKRPYQNGSSYPVA